MGLKGETETSMNFDPRLHSCPTVSHTHNIPVLRTSNEISKLYTLSLSNFSFALLVSSGYTLLCELARRIKFRIKKAPYIR